ncbi:class I SAM-dependent methyltransferase [Patescibacteria group bacterium]|nr:class I SAM-dependent methyltransferase [Patescibacteria group bacterium]
MKNKLSKKQLKDIYQLDAPHKWMELINSGEENNPYFKTYLRQKKRLENLLKPIKFNSDFRVVEYGCGNGLWGELIHNRVKSYTGVDFSEQFINLAKRRHKALNIRNTRFNCNDIIKFSEEHDNEFDQAFSMDFSEHVYDDDFISIFTAIRNTLKPNGKLYLHTPNGDYFLELCKKNGILKQSVGHIGIRNVKKHINLLEKVGFKNIVIYYLPHYIKLLSVFHFISYLPIIGKFFKARLLIKCIK